MTGHASIPRLVLAILFSALAACSAVKNPSAAADNLSTSAEEEAQSLPRTEDDRVVDRLDAMTSTADKPQESSLFESQSLVEQSVVAQAYPSQFGNNSGDSRQQETTYRIKKHDTLQKISLSFFGKSALWSEIAHTNRIDDPSQLKIGSSIIIPSLTHLKTAKSSPPGRDSILVDRALITAGKLSIKVEKGDTLSSIASKALGKATSWPVVFAHNKNVIRNPNRLKIGQLLQIPGPNALTH